MPTYGYECTACKEQFEVFQKITDDPLAIHEDCGGELRRLLYPVGIVFKGSGFHVNDYGRHGKKSATEVASSTSETKSDSSTTAKAETKPEAKPETTSAAKTD